MAMAPRLELRQGQSLVMTPQLQQAIKLLQLSNLELSAYVEAELEKNPLLERPEGEPGGDTGGEPNGAEPPANEPPPTETVVAELGSTAPTTEANYDVDREAEFERGGKADLDGYDRFDTRIAGSGGSFDGEDFDFESRLSERKTLRQHLMDQLPLEIADPVERLIGAQLIGLVDEQGYLREPLADVAERLGAPLAKVEAVLTRCQGFDPTGVMARDLAECLRLQLRERDRLDPAMAALIDHLNLAAARDVAALIKICGVDAEDIADMMAEIRTLNPRPGAVFEREDVETIIPDVLVRRAQNQEWLVELNNETLPRILVNERYYARVSGGTRDKATKTYLSECLASANWLKKSLDQRATTILKVASEIVRQQEAFLEQGVQHLRPLNLRAIAEAIGMHESTVSRVTANKYMATPRGMFELKYFFTAAIAATNGGAAHSAESVRHRIKTLVDAEGQDVLSDDRLVAILKADGIDIARRTVAKYRDALRIPSSVQRRRDKGLGA